MSAPYARRLLVEGRVQGVFFRASTARRAEAAGVVGWVRNLPDGRVEAWLEGRREAVEQVERWARSGGPPAARVTAVTAEDVTPAGHERFEVRR